MDGSRALRNCQDGVTNPVYDPLFLLVNKTFVLEKIIDYHRGHVACIGKQPLHDLLDH
jgi:hypothetical protein